MIDMVSRHVDLRSIFGNLQTEMLSKLTTVQEAVRHPGAKGDVAEQEWREMLNLYLPRRYSADKAFVLDADGQVSEEVDIVLYDCQYSPFLLNKDGARYIPAESVYAVIEVKSRLGRKEIEYASSKAESVRRLRRTSAPVPYVAGEYPPKKPYEILAGVLAPRSVWRPPLGSSLDAVISELPHQGRMDLGCSLQDGGFEAIYEEGEDPVLKRSREGDALIFFFLRLLSRLQRMGTALALDIAEYARFLETD